MASLADRWEAEDVPQKVVPLTDEEKKEVERLKKRLNKDYNEYTKKQSK